MGRERVLVTGATGFVGTALCNRLSKDGHYVIAAGRRRPLAFHDEFRLWDILQPVPAALLRGVDRVFHLAGRAHAVADSQSSAHIYDVVNRVATEVLTEAVVQSNVASFVFVSSCKASPVGPRRFIDPYGVSKWAAERAVLRAHERLHVSIVRPVLVYGPGCKGNLLQMMVAIDDGRVPPLPKVDNRRSLIGLHDLTTALVLASADPRARGQVMTVTDDDVYSTDRMLKALAAPLNRAYAPRLRIPRPVLEVGGRMGDFAEVAFGLRPPLNTAAVERLIGSAEYEIDQTLRDIGFVPTETLEQAAPAMARVFKAERRVGYESGPRGLCHD